MSHPALGLPPSDPRAGLPEAAGRLRAQRRRLADVALEAALRRDPGLRERHDELQLRKLLRDTDRHLEQLARALETGEVRYVTIYAEWLMPTYRRRHVPARDQATLLDGLQDACQTVLAPGEAAVAGGYLDAWRGVLQHHAALPGDHRGNPVVRFVYKGAGILDETVV